MVSFLQQHRRHCTNAFSKLYLGAGVVEVWCGGGGVTQSEQCGWQTLDFSPSTTSRLMFSQQKCNFMKTFKSYLYNVRQSRHTFVHLVDVQNCFNIWTSDWYRSWMSYKDVWKRLRKKFNSGCWMTSSECSMKTLNWRLLDASLLSGIGSYIFIPKLMHILFFF